MPKRVSFDEDFFENIDTEEKAYWLGFIYADGYLSEVDNVPASVGVCLSVRDVEHLQKFKTSL